MYLPLTTHIVTLWFGTETVVVAKASSIVELLALASGAVVGPGGEASTTGPRLHWLQTLPEDWALLWLHTLVSQLHRPRRTLAHSCTGRGGEGRGREERGGEGRGREERRGEGRGGEGRGGEGNATSSIIL